MLYILLAHMVGTLNQSLNLLLLRQSSKLRQKKKMSKIKSVKHSYYNYTLVLSISQKILLSILLNCYYVFFVNTLKIF